MSDKDVQRAVEINELISEGIRYDRPNVFEDAYHAGLSIATSHHKSEDINDYYRGERLDGRALRPSLYHGVDYLDPEPSDRELIEERLHTLRRFIDRLKENHDLPSETYTDADLVAIAQHYRWELSDDAPDVRTWLLDVTSNPFTALLFGTYSEKKSCGETGVVYHFNLDWLDQELSSDAGFRPVVPAGIPRTVRQEGTFLEMHPEFLNQFVGDRIRFKQHPCLVFEDPYLGITASRVFPEQDRIRQSLETERLGPSIRISDIKDLEFEAVDEPPMSDVVPPFDLFLDPASTYERLVEQIYADTRRDPSELDEAAKDGLHYIGRFHGFLQREFPEERATLATSINRLQDAVGAFDPGQEDSVESALREGYENKLGDHVDFTALIETFEKR
ncbi:FRG domain-containing protein [Halopenitus salinus]|uniref:FRG domain-containing protein n=1 Tax=Halopenitus salinus TaxID=1198295 RepID=A0ABD5UQ74_9EURY